MLKKVVSVLTIMTMLLLFNFSGINVSAATSNGEKIPKANEQLSKTYPVAPDTPVTIENNGKVVFKTTHADFMKNEKKYLSGSFKRELALKENSTASKSVVPQYVGEDISVNYVSNSDSYEGSGSDGTMDAYVNFGPTYVNNGDIVRSYNYLTNVSNGPQAFFYKVGWDPDKLNYIEPVNISRCQPITSYSVDPYGSNHMISLYYGSPAEPSSTLQPGQQGCSFVKFSWTGGSSSYFWRDRNNDSLLFQAGERAGGTGVTYFYSTDYVVIN